MLLTHACAFPANFISTQDAAAGTVRGQQHGRQQMQAQPHTSALLQPPPQQQQRHNQHQHRQPSQQQTQQQDYTHQQQPSPQHGSSKPPRTNNNLQQPGSSKAMTQAVMQNSAAASHGSKRDRYASPADRSEQQPPTRQHFAGNMRDSSSNAYFANSSKRAGWTPAAAAAAAGGGAAGAMQPGAISSSGQGFNRGWQEAQRGSHAGAGAPGLGLGPEGAALAAHARQQQRGGVLHGKPFDLLGDMPRLLQDKGITFKQVKNMLRDGEQKEMWKVIAAGSGTARSSRQLQLQRTYALRGHLQLTAESYEAKAAE
jgi:hypothetical protein